jgi:hypothetical protein
METRTPVRPSKHRFAFASDTFKPGVHFALFSVFIAKPFLATRMLYPNEIHVQKKTHTQRDTRND